MTIIRLLHFASISIVFLSISFCFEINTYGQGCQVIGKIFNYETKQPIKSRLVFEKQPDASLTVIASSGPNGYKANLFDRGLYSLMISAEGFVTERLFFDLKNDSIKDKNLLDYNFELIPIQIKQVLPFHKILFDVSSFQISYLAVQELERLSVMMLENPTIKIQLEGHTDSQGKSKSNVKLAKKRIASIKKWLVKKKISQKRIKLKALGGGKPLTHSDDPDARRANRRVEVRVIEL